MADAPAKIDVDWLVAECYEAVYRYAFRLTGAAVDAEDLTQQAFLVAQQKFTQLRQPESARSWLFAILRNCWLKTWKRQEAVSASGIGLDLDAVPSAVEDAQPIDSDRLQEAISEIPAEFRVVLAMFYFENFSYREIADELGLPMGTVMSRLARAKRHLRARLFEQEAPTTPEPKPSLVR